MSKTNLVNSIVESCGLNFKRAFDDAVRIMDIGEDISFALLWVADIYKLDDQETSALREALELNQIGDRT